MKSHQNKKIEVTKLIKKIEDDDDVQNVYHTLKMDLVKINFFIQK